MSPFSAIYANLILKGLKNPDDIPNNILQEEVKKICFDMDPTKASKVYGNN